MNQVLRKDAIAQSDLIKQKEISPTELVEASIEAVESLNPQLNAVITPMYEEARAALGQIDIDAPFAGVPMLLKDGIASYKGVRFSSGSNMLKGNIAKEDSELVKRYKKAGFIIIGKTNMPEFGLLPTTESDAFGACHNPWALSKTPGGSSGGSAAAVAARMVALAHGNDGGGSIRIPASCCGLFGLKPSRARNPLGPFSSLVNGLVEEHVLTRSVRDSAAVLDITGVPDPYGYYAAPPKGVDSYLSTLDQPVRKLKIAYSMTTPFGGPIDRECEIAVEQTVSLCKDLGHELTLKNLDIPFTGKDLGEMFNALWAVGATTPIAFYHLLTGSKPEAGMVEPLSAALYEVGVKITGPRYELFRLQMHKVARAVLAFFDDIDVWLTSTLGMPPVDLGLMTQNPDQPMAPMKVASKFSPMTAIFNISGQPSASVPVHQSLDELPIGVQITSKFGDETTLFQLAHQMEKLLKWQERTPVIIS